MNQNLKLPDIFQSKVFKSLSEKALKIFSDQDLVLLLNKILENIDWEKLLIGEGLLFLFVLFLRSYAFSKTRGFFSQLWAEIWTWVLFLSLSLFFVPLFVIGEEYLEILKIVIRLLKK